MNFGGGFKTDSGMLSVRYHIGLDLYDQGRSHNRVWQFSVGFVLAFYE
jgi:hypothetical protein